MSSPPLNSQKVCQPAPQVKGARSSARFAFSFAFQTSHMNAFLHSFDLKPAARCTRLCRRPKNGIPAARRQETTPATLERFVSKENNDANDARASPDCSATR